MGKCFSTSHPQNPTHVYPCSTRNAVIAPCFDWVPRYYIKLKKKKKEKSQCTWVFQISHITWVKPVKHSHPQSPVLHHLLLRAHENLQCFFFFFLPLSAVQYCLVHSSWNNAYAGELQTVPAINVLSYTLKHITYYNGAYCSESWPHFPVHLGGGWISNVIWV